MNPIYPKKTTPPQNQKPMATPAAPVEPPLADEDYEVEEVERGMEVAENEVREMVADVYEAAAANSDEPEESLDDIDYEEEQAKREGPDQEPGSI